MAQLTGKIQADAAYLKGDFEAAEALYTQALLEAPDDERLWTNRAQTYLQLKRWSEAINDCSEALKRNPYNLKALFRRGKAYEQQGNIKAAKEDWNLALIQDPKNKTVQEALFLLNKTKINCTDEKVEKVVKKIPIAIKEVETLPSWAENEYQHNSNTKEYKPSLNGLKYKTSTKEVIPTLQILEQKLRTMEETEISKQEKLMYFFSINYVMLPHLFGTAGLEGIFLETFLHAIKYAYQQEKDKIKWWKQSLGILQQLSCCSRFDIAILFVKKTILEDMNQLFEKAIIEMEEKIKESYRTIWEIWMNQGT
ncbi:hypothetical protein PNEG_02553 [Pneumocystis murina B123]|uniref:RNA polymerase II-associated protein 3 n=1 Tax=Pneumocystis murina (strain B123) TaxID=1069680 RepID=M7NPN7_PNEMU|nr:hypothetical protein PNEG_02553 [Pneumocystis murina B123]EMR09217.1 hypothetical protein PNEG_02553 [Pneumocystis murina B123]